MRSPAQEAFKDWPLGCSCGVKPLPGHALSLILLTALSKLPPPLPAQGWSPWQSQCGALSWLHTLARTLYGISSFLRRSRCFSAGSCCGLLPSTAQHSMASMSLSATCTCHETWRGGVWPRGHILGFHRRWPCREALTCWQSACQLVSSCKQIGAAGHVQAHQPPCHGSWVARFHVSDALMACSLARGVDNNQDGQSQATDVLDKRIFRGAAKHTALSPSTVVGQAADSSHTC